MLNKLHLAVALPAGAGFVTGVVGAAASVGEFVAVAVGVALSLSCGF